ncbi:MAG: hypothetical protein BroJett018_09480 [Chloroflexota bacterium]|nr:M1 family peptidase [Chloroflexota bacterium]NOG62637.1 M1 family metallopeptidase [Chloroflexota bacterium]GIK63154.1 MAG: hypothetical protein BroJett018_09480 [Chloroflexota bacterium]
MLKKIGLGIWVGLLFGVMACNLSGAEEGNALPTRTLPPAALFTLPPMPSQAPLVAGQINATPIPTNTAEPVCTSDTTLRQVRYEAEATLDWPTQSVQVQQTTIYRNDSQDYLHEIVFHAEPNHLPDIMTLEQVVDADGHVIEGVTLEGTRLSVPLQDKLGPNCEIVLHLNFSLKLPAIYDSYGGRWGYLGYSFRQTNLGLWLPTIAIYEGDGNWYVPREYNIGEQTMPIAGDYDVELTVVNAPPSLQVAGPGEVAQPESDVWTFKLDGARDLSISLSDAVQKTSAMAGGVLVELYYFPDNAPTGLNPAGHALDTAQKALVVFAQSYGPYPYDRLVIVEGDFPDGMEFTGMVFVSEAWFRTWSGNNNDWLTIITAHEVSHQWWYGLVSNDQGLNPYLDEALATYSELLFFERTDPEQVNWWWNFRILKHPTEDAVDSPVYNFTAFRGYIDAVYLRGVLMLQDVRDMVGDAAFFAWLKSYVANNRGRIATPSDLWGSLPPDEFTLVAEIRRTYLNAKDSAVAGEPTQQFNPSQVAE